MNHRALHPAPVRMAFVCGLFHGDWLPIHGRGTFNGSCLQTCLGWQCREGRNGTPRGCEYSRFWTLPVSLPVLFSAEHLTSGSRGLDLWTIWPEEVPEDLECVLLEFKVTRSKVQFLGHLIAKFATQHHHLAFIALDLVPDNREILKG